MNEDMTGQELRRRRWRFDEVPVRFPAWRRWVDSRVRTDDAILDSLAGLDLALVALDARAESDSDLVPELFSKAELPYGSGFSVTVGLARERLREAEEQVVLNAFPIYVAGFDRLLGHVIRMLRGVGLDQSDSDESNIGLDKKLGHLKKNSRVRLDPTHEELWRLLIAIRNSVIHSGSSEEPVAKAWARCARVPSRSSESGQEAWSQLAERPLPLSGARQLRFGDREVRGCQRVLDRIANDLASQLRLRVSPSAWALLVIRDAAPNFKSVINNPTRNVKALRAWCEKDWGVSIDDETARAALESWLSRSAS